MRSRKKKDKAVSFRKCRIQKKLSSGFSQKSSGLGKPNLTNPVNKMFLRFIYLKKKSTFTSVKITVGTLIDVRNEISKHHFIKSDKINT